MLLGLGCGLLEASLQLLFTEFDRYLANDENVLVLVVVCRKVG